MDSVSESQQSCLLSNKLVADKKMVECFYDQSYIRKLELRFERLNSEKLSRIAA